MVVGFLPLNPKTAKGKQRAVFQFESEIFFEQKWRLKILDRVWGRASARTTATAIGVNLPSASQLYLVPLSSRNRKNSRNSKAVDSVESIVEMNNRLFFLISTAF